MTPLHRNKCPDLSPIGQTGWRELSTSKAIYQSLMETAPFNTGTHSLIHPPSWCVQRPGTFLITAYAGGMCQSYVSSSLSDALCLLFYGFKMKIIFFLLTGFLDQVAWVLLTSPRTATPGTNLHEACLLGRTPQAGLHRFNLFFSFEYWCHPVISAQKAFIFGPFTWTPCS